HRCAQDIPQGSVSPHLGRDSCECLHTNRVNLGIERDDAVHDMSNKIGIRILDVDCVVLVDTRLDVDLHRLETVLQTEQSSVDRKLVLRTTISASLQIMDSEQVLTERDSVR